MRIVSLLHFVPRSGFTLAAAACLLLPAAGYAQAPDATDGPGITAAPMSTDVLPSQPVGADDLLQVTIPYCPELSRSFRIGSDGHLVLPLIKEPLPVAGMMPSAVGKTIAAALVKDGILNQPSVSVSVLEYRSRPIHVVGAVNRPLLFQASRDTTLLDAITKAGGLTTLAGSDISVTHTTTGADGNTNVSVMSIPVKGLIESADPKLNIRLTGNDEIRVPEAGRIFVAGNVKKPGSYAMQDNSDTTVVKALALSEGLESYTSKTAYIYRQTTPGAPRQEIQVALAQIMKRKSPDVTLQADDILYVPEDARKRMTAKVLAGMAGFGTSTAAGVLIYR